jgi:hypothetical protein
VTSDDAPDDGYDAKLARLAELAAAEKQQAAALKETRRVAKGVAVEALKAGIAEGRLGVRSEVQRNSPFSPPTIRELADAAGIPPDERYVRTPKTAPSATIVREVTPRAEPPVPPSARSEYAPVAADIARLPKAHVEKLAAAMKRQHGAQWMADVRAQFPGDDEELWVYRVVEYARDKALIPERDLFPQEP